MNIFRSTLLVLSVAGLLAACQHTKPLVTETTDRTGWVKVGEVGAVFVTSTQRAMDRAGIPAWFDAKGYPYYPVTVPPQYRNRAIEILKEQGLMRASYEPPN